MSIQDLLNKKYFEWQSREGRKTIEEFAAQFGVSQGLVSMWMNGKRTPGPENKERIIEIYGEEAIRAFGEDPDLYAVQKSWEYLTPAQRRNISKQATKQALENDIKRTHQKRTTRRTD